MINSGDILRAYIKQHSVNQTKLAAALETSRSNFSQKIAKKELDTYTIAQISKALKHNFFEDIAKEFYKSTGITNQSVAKRNEPDADSDFERAVIKVIHKYQLNIK